MSSSSEYRDAKSEAKAEKARAKALRPWFRKKRFILPLIGLVLIVVIAAVSAGGSDPAPKKSLPESTTSASVPAPVEEDVSISQRNALGKAESYLKYQPMSRQGLINQLTAKVEGFSTADATYAADKVGADWNEQAAKKAELYLKQQNFSKDGLIAQLVSPAEGFTPEQAAYGVSKAGF